MAFNIATNEPMAKYLSWRTGGNAWQFYTPANTLELSNFLVQNRQPILFLGLGSNLLIKDEGFAGVVIYTKKLNQLSHQGSTINAQSGVPLAKIARLSNTLGIYGAEFLATIPGTLGGALAMNAGCFGFEMWQWVQWVQTINERGETHRRTPADFVLAYRQVLPRYGTEYFLSAQLQFSRTSVGQNSATLLKKRRQTQPSGSANCGSVFKNPSGHYAGMLIEQAGLKGFCIGDACISTKHANFIINTKNATTNDIQKLVKHIQKTIKQRFGIELETEVQIL